MRPPSLGTTLPILNPDHTMQDTCLLHPRPRFCPLDPASGFRSGLLPG